MSTQQRRYLLVVMLFCVSETKLRPIGCQHFNSIKRIHNTLSSSTNSIHTHEKESTIKNEPILLTNPTRKKHENIASKPDNAPINVFKQKGKRETSKLRSIEAILHNATLTPPSKEQRLIINAVNSREFNVQVNAVAGSGKTTTLLHIANESAKGSSILALLYNKRLKEETRAKKVAYNLEILEVHSFHAFGVKYYGAPDAAKDEGLVRIIEDNVQPFEFFAFDLIILDEVQDMTPVLYAFVNKILRDNRNLCNLLLLGDVRQNIFQFRDADSRYLSLASRVFGLVNKKPWKTLELKTSFRLSNNICSFLNQNVLHYPLFKTIKPAGPKVQYYLGNPFKAVDHIGSQLVELLTSRKCEPQDIFILAPSVKQGKADKQTPVNALANYLMENGFPYYTPVNEDTQLDDKVMFGKIVVTTIHQSKGLERKIVILSSFSSEYFDYYDKSSVRTVCPNVMYVACTRAKEYLILIGESHEGDGMPFLSNTQNTDYLEIISVSRLAPRKIERPPERSKPTVSRLCKYLPEPTLRDAMQFLHTRRLSPPTRDVRLQSLVNTDTNRFEEVFELTGLALPAMFESQSTQQKSTIQKYSTDILSKGSNNIDLVYANEININYKDDDVNGYLRLAAIYSYVTTGFENKPVQIKSFDWVTKDNAKVCLQILGSYLQGKIRYEVQAEHSFKWPADSSRLVTIVGRIDAITRDAIYELKCTQQLEDVHLLQLGLYAWLSQQNPNIITGKVRSRSYRLLNMRTDEMIELLPSSDLTSMVGVLVEKFLRGDPNVSDENFLAEIENIKATGTLSGHNSRKASTSSWGGQKKDLI